jgi:hypothetical protein
MEVREDGAAMKSDDEEDGDTANTVERWNTSYRPFYLRLQDRYCSAWGGEEATQGRAVAVTHC